MPVGFKTARFGGQPAPAAGGMAGAKPKAAAPMAGAMSGTMGMPAKGGMAGGTMGMPAKRPAPMLSPDQELKKQHYLDVAEQSGPVNSFMYRNRAAMLQPEQAKAPVRKPMAAKPMPAKPMPAKAMPAKPKMTSKPGGYRTVTHSTNTGENNVLSRTPLAPKLQSKTSNTIPT